MFENIPYLFNSLPYFFAWKVILLSPCTHRSPDCNQSQWRISWRRNEAELVWWMQRIRPYCTLQPPQRCPSLGSRAEWDTVDSRFRAGWWRGRKTWHARICRSDLLSGHWWGMMMMVGLVEPQLGSNGWCIFWAVTDGRWLERWQAHNPHVMMDYGLIVWLVGKPHAMNQVSALFSTFFEKITTGFYGVSFSLMWVAYDEFVRKWKLWQLLKMYWKHWHLFIMLASNGYIHLEWLLFM